MAKGTNGSTIIREIVTPKNPRTNAQLIQRAIMATVMQAYSAGKAIFDHSFQGESVGAANQRKFMSLNAKMLRAAVANDINNNLVETNVTARCVAPGASTPVPNNYIISRGSYPQNFFTWDEQSGFTFPATEANETCAAYCSRVGLVPEDIFTVVAFVHPEGKNEETWPESLSNQKSGIFGFVRIQVKESALTDPTPITNLIATLTETAGVPFIITERFNSNCNLIVNDTEEAFSISELQFAAPFGAIGIIRSRLDKDLRSDSEMHVAISNAPYRTTGLANPYILPVWKAGTEQLGNSDLILEGGDF